ncbi:MAG TPA: Asp23/Gls24 family envelope stress response protein [Coriobacteriia bacterium]|nr:Asp23/Gls24 family envelope stress response protein [Coriobacteriia bacterium]
MDDKKLMSEGLTIAPGVIETIVSLAVGQIDGVAQVGTPGLSENFLSAFNKKHSAQGILILADDDGQITLDIHVLLYYGFKLQDVAAEIRSVAADTLSGQVGIDVAKVDVYVDGIRFPE